jgi:hypothetical protein
VARLGRVGPTRVEWVCAIVVLSSLLFCVRVIAESAHAPVREGAVPTALAQAASRDLPKAASSTRRLRPSSHSASDLRSSERGSLPGAAPAQPDDPTDRAAPEQEWTRGAIRSLWVRAADRADASGEIDRLASARRTLAPESAEAELARIALDDLMRLRDRRMAADAIDEEGMLAPGERIDELRDALRYSDDPGEIRSALRELGGQRGEEAVEAMLSVGPLPEPSQRQKSLRLLWRMAADDLETDHRDAIREELDRARYAANLEEARIAVLALEDLDRLDSLSREQAR